MDPKPSPPPQPPPPPPKAPPRRRGAAGKRKATEAPAAASPSPAPKRQAQERNTSDLPPPPPPPPPPRPSRKPARKPARKSSRKKATRVPVKPPPPPPPPRAQEAPAVAPARRQSVEEEVEAVVSRGAGVHVVPTFAGWFSWKEIHPIEKQALATFFDGKSERRTPEIYLGIRNYIMDKFHFNPQVNLESKDLTELSIGEMDARQEVLEFLAHWGLVNFHPFLPSNEECKLVEENSHADTDEKVSLVEKLFHFETVQSYLVPVPNKTNFAPPAQVSSLVSEPTLTDALITAESSVEYHCNYCSVDCSRKRYHCRTQADFDLCSDCYNEEKFGKGMSQSDFILMESAEVPGSGGTSWTVEETLLLLEALEIFEGAQWDDIAEHVATKTKAQCMLYFLQMPILDSFPDGEDSNETVQNITEQASVENDTFDVPEKMGVKEKPELKESTNGKTLERANSNSAETGTRVANKNVSAKEGSQISGDDDLIAPSIVVASNKSSDADPTNKNTSGDVDVSGEHISNFVIDVLRSAFKAVGHFPEKEDIGSFGEAGNPVMALAALLAGLAEHNDGVTSCYTSLKAISEISPALQLATRHCFILHGPPNDIKDATFSASSASIGGEHQKGDDTTPNADGTGNDSLKKEESGLALEQQNASFTSQKENQKLANTKGSLDEVPQTVAKFNRTTDSENPVAMAESSGEPDEMRYGCKSVSYSNNQNDITVPGSQEVSAANTGDRTDLERRSEELPTDAQRSQGKVEPKKIKQAPSAVSGIQQAKSYNTDSTEESNSSKNIAADDDYYLKRLQRAAGTAISAAAVKAKLLAKEEEEHIQQLAALVIEKQFEKMETKMSFFAEIQNMVLRARGLTEKTRRKLSMDRNALLASQMAAMMSRRNQHGVPGIRLPVGYVVNQHPR
ncbi:hypothetical protein ACP4OV_010359 [Aristida adscensionis]